MTLLGCLVVTLVSVQRLSDLSQRRCVRAALESSGLDHGPVGVHDKMRAMGLQLVTSRHHFGVCAAINRCPIRTSSARTDAGSSTCTPSPR